MLSKATFAVMGELKRQEILYKFAVIGQKFVLAVLNGLKSTHSAHDSCAT